MAKDQPTLFSVNGGEIDARTQARADLDIYPRCASVLENIFITLKGSMAKAPGSKHIDMCPESDVVVVRPFYYSGVAYHLELSDGLLRFVSGDELVQAAATDATIGAWSDESAAPSTGGGAPSDGGDSGIGDPIGGGGYYADMGYNGGALPPGVEIP